MFVEEIKIAARITSSNLDEDIKRVESYAIKELERVGVPKEILEKDDPYELIKNAVITYGQAQYASEKEYPRLIESWNYQKDCLRNHDWEVENNEES